jgi:hypothetical protein
MMEGGREPTERSAGLAEPSVEKAAETASDPTQAESGEAPGDQAHVPTPAICNVQEFDWGAVQDAVSPSDIKARMRDTVEAFEMLLDGGPTPGLLFDNDRNDASDQAIQVGETSLVDPLWIVGDLHGDLLALEAALAVINKCADEEGSEAPGIIFLGDLFDDEGFGLELLLRIFELVLASPGRVCVIVGNHDESLGYDGSRFSSSVSPGDFADFLNENLAHEWIERAGKLAVRFFAQAPHALFLPDGLLVAHAGFPLGDLHAQLEKSGNWNDPACLSDFTWTRAHPIARKKMPNRFTRGSQFGREDFADFCELSARMGRPVTHMVRGHDHVEERFAVYPAYDTHPMLTTVALSRRLPRESFGPHERVPTIARYLPGSLPQVYRLHIPAEIVRVVFPEAEAETGSSEDPFPA